MTSIPFAICRFSENNFKHFCLKKKRHSGDFLLYFRNVQNLEHSEKKEEYPSLIITEIIAFERYLYLSV